MIYVYREDADGRSFYKLRDVYEDIEEFMNDHPLIANAPDSDGWYVMKEGRFKLFDCKELKLTREPIYKWGVI